MALLIAKAVQGAATGIGLASEAIKDHKEKKRAQKADLIEKDKSEVEDVAPHKMVWELDAAQDAIMTDPAILESSPPEGSGKENPLKIAASFIQRHPLPKMHSKDAYLPLPVVLPQRRPESRVRGFIRAYAPLLENSHIDQATFLEFIHDMNVVCLPNPWIQAINMASFATMHMPTITGIIVSRIIQKTASAISEVHSRSK